MKDLIKKIIPHDRKILVFWIVLVFLAFIIGLMVSGGNGEDKHYHKEGEELAAEATIWTCSMHPQIQQPKPGQCPICGMDLIPVKTGGIDGDNPRQLTLSATARKLAEIEIAMVERKFVEHEVRMVGKIEVDETRLNYITSWISGRIDRQFVNYNGISIRKGDHLVELYSPEVLTTHRELMESAKLVKQMEDEGMSAMLNTARQQLNSVKERLRLWGLTEKQVSELERTAQPSDHITIYSPVSGVVVAKEAGEGMYVNTGTRLYTIADLSKVWLKMDAYEADLPWLRYGQDVEFHVAAYPGEVFNGKIAFIDPVLNQKTRTVKIRVNVDNTDGRLKPEMFVNSIVKSKITSTGKVFNPDLAGKWISPMHPEIIKNKPGTCDVCGMPLVRVEDLGYVSASELEAEEPLVIPVTAPLITGTRAVVYVEVPGKEGAYEGREIKLGSRAGEYYIVKSGLEEGEKVVAKGNFKIDSAIQIQAKPSMMNPAGGVAAIAHHHHDEAPKTIHSPKSEVKQGEVIPKIPQEFKKQLDDVYIEYFDLQYALSHDQFEPVKGKVENLVKALGQVNMKLLEGQEHIKWMELLDGIKKSADEMKRAGDIEFVRAGFDKLSQSIIEVARTFGSAEQQLLLFHCPMAFENRGADWLQNKTGVENPYYGSKMFRCGEQTGDLRASE